MLLQEVKNDIESMSDKLFEILVQFGLNEKELDEKTTQLVNLNKVLQEKLDQIQKLENENHKLRNAKFKNHFSVKIYKTEFFPLKNEGKLKGKISVILGESLLISGIRLYEGSKGFFVSYPNNPDNEEKDYSPAFMPMDKDLRNAIELEIFQAYQIYLHK